jgi:hypothetical protein
MNFKIFAPYEAFRPIFQERWTYPKDGAGGGKLRIQQLNTSAPTQEYRRSLIN